MGAIWSGHGRIGENNTTPRANEKQNAKEMVSEGASVRAVGMMSGRACVWGEVLPAKATCSEAFVWMVRIPKLFLRLDCHGGTSWSELNVRYNGR